MASPFKAILLSAGTGTRLRPLTDVLPKCLMPINGRPLLGLWLTALLDAGVRDIIVNTHYLPDLVQNYIEASPFAPFVTLSYESELLGTGGTLLKHKDRLSDGSFLLAHADNLTAFDPTAFAAAHERRARDTLLTMMTFVTDAPQSCGIVEVDDENMVIGFHEKVENPPGNLANAAVYMGHAALFPILERLDRHMIDFSIDVLPELVGRIQIFRNDRYHRDIGTPASLLRAQLDYPLIKDAWQMSASEPWYGLMQRDDRCLASAFLAAIDRVSPGNGNGPIG